MGSKPATVGAAENEPTGSGAAEVERWRQLGARLQAIDPFYFVALSTRVEVAVAAREAADTSIILRKPGCS